MRLIDSILSKVGLVRQTETRKQQRFGYDGARDTRFTSDWQLSTVSQSRDIRNALVKVRDRARDLVNNDDYAKGYIRQMKTNVVGAFGFSMKINPSVRDQAFRDNAERIKESYFDWCERENCSLAGDLRFLDMQHLAISGVARDGELCFRVIRNKNFKYGFMLEPLQVELLDESYTEILNANKVVVMGIEYDRNTWRKTAYYFRDIPIESQIYGYITTAGYRKRIPAEEIIFSFDAEYVKQMRGISWMVQSLNSMRQLSKYDEATLHNARVRATFGGFLNTDKDAPNNYEGDSEDAQGNMQMELEDGVWKQLPPGVSAIFADNNFPSAQYESYTNSKLRRQSVGLGVAGSVHSGNYSDVNFSSERARQIAVRDNFMLAQEWFIGAFLEPIGKIFIKEAWLTGAINFPLSELDQYSKIIWKGRRWAYVNPEQEMRTNQMKWDMGVKSISEIIEESDGNLEPEEVFQQIAEDKKMAKKYGISITTNSKQEVEQEKPEKKNDNDDKDKVEDSVIKEANTLLNNARKNGKTNGGHAHE